MYCLSIRAVIIAIDALVSVPTRYFSAKSLSSSCLNRATLFAVSTKPMAPIWFASTRITIMSLSSFPMILPARGSDPPLPPPFGGIVPLLR